MGDSTRGLGKETPRVWCSIGSVQRHEAMWSAQAGEAGARRGDTASPLALVRGLFCSTRPIPAQGHCVGGPGEMGRWQK